MLLQELIVDKTLVRVMCLMSSGNSFFLLSEQISINFHDTPHYGGVLKKDWYVGSTTELLKKTLLFMQAYSNVWKYVNAY